jgi:hypothetical protein
MKRRSFFILLLALIFIVALSACGGGPDKRIAASGALISTYFNTDAQSGNVVVLSVKSYQDGYISASIYKGSGNHLVLFKIAKVNGADAITATAEGEAAKTPDYSVNIIADGDKTILFGDFANTASGYSKIDFVFDNGSHVTETIDGGKGFIVVSNGSLKVKDFTLFGAKGEVVGSYQDFLKAGGSIIRTTFVDSAAK